MDELEGMLFAILLFWIYFKQFQNARQIRNEENERIFWRALDDHDRVEEEAARCRRKRKRETVSKHFSNVSMFQDPKTLNQYVVSFGYC